MSLLSWIGKKIRLTDGAFWSQFYGGSSYAGKSVSPNSALQLSAVWSCVRLIAETVATLPLMVYEEDRDGTRSLARDNALFRVLHDQPNADFTAAEFWEGIAGSLLLWGNGYAEKTISAGELRALTMLRPEGMRVERAPRTGELVYRYSWDGEQRTYSESEIFHVRGFGIGLDVGLSPIAYARHSLGSAMATEEMTGAIYANGARPSGFLTIDNVLKPEQRTQLQKNIVEPYVGSDKAGGVMVLEAGMKFVPVTMKPEDAQMIATRAFQVEELCRWFRVPPFMIGHSEKSTSWGSGLEQQNIGFLTYALRPYLTRLEQAIRRQLIRPEDRRRLTAEFNLEGLLRADSAARSQFYSTMAQNGILTRNEARRKENYPPMPGGDVLTVQSNLVPIDQLGQAGDGQAARSAFRAWLGVNDEEKEQ